MILLSETKNLLNLEYLDLRVNKLGKKWEEKLKEKGQFPKLSQLRIAGLTPGLILIILAKLYYGLE